MNYELKFGPAGNSLSFFEMGYKSSVSAFEYLDKLGLTAYEYQCGRGVRISDESASQIKSEAEKHGIAVSLHAPYYISMSSVEPEKRDNSVKYILESAAAVSKMGGNRIVIHTGSAGKIDRDEAMLLAADTMKKAIKALDNAGFSHIHMCPETMGKAGQLGTLEEVVMLCLLDDRIIPCVDFGHLNARSCGGLKSKADFEEVFDYIEDKLGNNRMKMLHCHFTKIEYTDKGEKKHLTFEDDKFGPDFEPFIEICLQKDIKGVIICESDGTQAEDARLMMFHHKQLTINN